MIQLLFKLSTQITRRCSLRISWAIVIQSSGHANLTNTYIEVLENCGNFQKIEELVPRGTEKGMRGDISLLREITTVTPVPSLILALLLP